MSMTNFCINHELMHESIIIYQFSIGLNHKKNTGSITFNGEFVYSFPLTGPEWDKLVEEMSSVPFPTSKGKFTLKLFEDNLKLSYNPTSIHFYQAEFLF